MCFWQGFGLPPVKQVCAQVVFAPRHAALSHCWPCAQLNVQLGDVHCAPAQLPFVQSNVHDLPPSQVTPAQPFLQSMMQSRPGGHEKMVVDVQVAASQTTLHWFVASLH